MKNILIFLCIAMTIFSCSDDDTSAKTGNIVLEFDTRAGSESDFELGESYQNELGQEFILTTLKFRISHITLTNQAGEVFEDEGVYTINDGDESSVFIALEKIPSGKYTSMMFTIGARGTAEYFEIEGTSNSSEATEDAIRYVIGGDVNLKIKELSFGDHVVTIAANKEPEFHVVVDVLKFFTGMHDIDFSELPVCEDNACASQLTDNYEDSFVLDHVHQ